MRKHTKKRDYRNAVLFHWPKGKDFLEDIAMAKEIEKWCDENLLDDFTAADMGIYIYEQHDMMAYKLRWL